MIRQFKIFTILSFLICITAIRSHASVNNLPPDDFILNVDCADLEIGQDSCFDLTIGNFNSIISIQFGLRWDFSVLRLSSIINLNSNLNLNNLNVLQAGPGQINMVWIDNSTTGIDRPDDEILFTMCFTAIGDVGAFSGFELVGTTPASGFEIANSDGVVLNVVENGCISNILGTTGFTVLPAQSCGPAMGSTTGAVNFDIFGVNGPFSYTYEEQSDPSNNGNGSISAMGGTITVDLVPGTYNFVFFDSDNSRVERVIVVPPSIQVLNLSENLPRCPSSSNGQIEVNIVDGANPYNYVWQNLDRPGLQGTGFLEDDSRTDLIPSLPPGRYLFTVVDNSGCQFEQIFLLRSNLVINANAEIRDARCPENADGEACVTPESSDGPSTFIVRFFDADGAMVSSLVTTVNGRDKYFIPNQAPGEYTVSILDNTSMCTFDTVLTIGAPDSINIILDTLRGPSCLNPSDGFIEVAPEGGISNNYDYSWSHDITVIGARAENLSIGDYTVTVTDDNNCSQEATFTLGPPISPTINSIDSISIGCSDPMGGELSVNFTIGNSPLASIEWFNTANGQVVSNNATASNLSGGNYLVVVTDVLGCTRPRIVSLASPTTLLLDSISIKIPDCPGEENARITMNISGGVSPYTFNWDHPNGSNGPTLAGIGAGDYDVTITDQENCGQIIQTVTVMDPPDINISFMGEQPVSCFQTICDGAATVEFDGGRDPAGTYFIRWENTETTAFVNNLCAGWQTVQITNDICTKIDSVFIDSPDTIRVLDDQITFQDISCHGETDGSVSIAASGGFPGYTYAWDTQENGSTISNLAAGDYEVTITDARMCMTTETFTVTEPDSLIAEIDPISSFDASCNGRENGQLVAIFSGGTGDVMYTWTNNVSNSAIAAQLDVGTYFVTVTDQNGCEAEAIGFIDEPAPLSVSIPQPIEPLCFGGRTEIAIDTVSGGNGGPYRYSINNGPLLPIDSVLSVLPSNYEIAVFDNRGCDITSSIFIGQPDPISISIDPVDPIQLGETTTLIARPSLNVALDSAVWSGPFDSLRCVGSDANCLAIEVGPFNSSQYEISIVDIDGCMASTSILVEVDKIRNVFVPNAISPNGDGTNDELRVFTGQGIRSIRSIRVFDRWGALMYESFDHIPNPSGIIAWDGTHRGKAMMTGVYVYAVEVEFIDNRTILYRGDVTLIK